MSTTGKGRGEPVAPSGRGLLRIGLFLEAPRAVHTPSPWATSGPANRMKGPCRYRYVWRRASCVQRLGCRRRGGGVLNADAVATVDDGPALCAVAGASGSAPARLRPRRVQRLGEFGKGAVPFAIFACPLRARVRMA